MNCAKITVTGNGQGFNGPALFVANLGAVNNIKTELGSDVIFPDPGDSVEFGGDGKRAPPVGFTAIASSAVQGEATSPALASNNIVSTTIPLAVGGPTTLQTLITTTTATVPGPTIFTMARNMTDGMCGRRGRKKSKHHHTMSTTKVASMATQMAAAGNGTQSASTEFVTTTVIVI